VIGRDAHVVRHLPCQQCLGGTWADRAEDDARRLGHARILTARHPAGVADAAIAHRRVASQRIAAGRFDEPADVVRWLGAVQAQDYNQALWAIGARVNDATAGGVERAIAERQIVRTWLMRGTIHFAAAEDVRWLMALCSPRLLAADERRCAQIGLEPADIERSADLLRDALAVDRRLSRPEVMELLESEGIETGRGHGYHILFRLAQDALICLGPMQSKQQTVVLLDDWAPRAQSRELSREQSLAALAERFAASRGPVTVQDLARWAGITVGDARRGLQAADGLVARTWDSIEYWLAAEGADEPPPKARSKQTFLLAGFDEYMLGYKDRGAMLAPEHADKIVPGANGVFRPIVVVDGQIVGTWARTARAKSLTIALNPFAPDPRLAAQVGPEAERYRDFLGLPGTCVPVVRSDSPVT
jgi:hypothetical protein